MKRTGFVALVGIVALAAAAARAQAPPPPPAPGAPAPAAAETPQPAGPSPKIHFDTITLDLGDVPKGQEAQAEFVFKNEGEAPLKILSAKPG